MTVATISSLVKDISLMQLETTRFGFIEVDEAAIVHFPLGLLGFERCTRFVIIESDDADPMRWLQGVDDPSLSLLIVEPGLFFADYDPALSAEDRVFLKLAADDEYVVACVVVVPEDPSLMTINLMGPLVLNATERIGKQLVLHDSPYSARQRLIPDAHVTEAVVSV